MAAASTVPDRNHAFEDSNDCQMKNGDLGRSKD